MRRLPVVHVFGLAVGLLLAIGGCSQETGSEPAAKASPAPAGSLAASEPCKLRMGWDPWEPYQYRNARGEVVGLDVEIARAVAEQAGCEIEFVEGRWMDLLERVQAGEVGLLAGATQTPGRERFATFTAPYRSESFVVYTLAGNDALRAIRTLDELLATDSRLGTVAEYYYGPEITVALNGLYQAGRLHEAALAAVNYERLVNGEIDAFIEDPFVAAAILRNHAGGERIVPTSVRVDAEDVAFMLSRKGVAPDVAARFGAALETLKTSGALEEIMGRYRAVESR